MSLFIVALKNHVSDLKSTQNMCVLILPPKKVWKHLLHPETIVEGCLYLNGNRLLWSEHNWLLWSESVMGYYGACMMGYYGLMVYGSYDQVAIQAAM